MAFFDDFGRKIQFAGEGVVNKGRTFADVTRLNAAVTDEEKKINNTYLQIGKLYVALHPHDYESDFGTMVDAIIASQDRIKAMKQQIMDLKGVTRCENCGAEVPVNTAFCSSCGKPMPKREPVVDENHMRCDKCGSIIEKGVRFCTNCGNPLVIPTAQPQAQPQPTAQEPQQEQPQTQPVQPTVQPPQAQPQTQPVQPEAKPIITCPSCGAPVRDNLKFCTKCGCSLDGSSNRVFSSSQGAKAAAPVKKTCWNCGKETTGEAFCVECGAKQNQ